MVSAMQVLPGLIPASVKAQAQEITAMNVSIPLSVLYCIVFSFIEDNAVKDT